MQVVKYDCVSRACQRGFKAYRVLANHSYFEGKRMKLLKRSRIPETRY